MKSIIYAYNDKNNTPMLSVGSYGFYKNDLKYIVKDLVWVMQIEHSDSRWECIQSLSAKDLMDVLNKTASNSLYKYYVN